MVPRGSSKDPSRPISWDGAGAWTLRQLRESSRSHRTRRAGRPPPLPAARAAAGTEPGAETSARPTTGRRFQRGCETREAAARGRRRVAGGRPVQSAPGREAAEGGGGQRRLLSREGTGSDSQVSGDNCGGRAGRTGTLGSRSSLKRRGRWRRLEGPRRTRRHVGSRWDVRRAGGTGRCANGGGRTKGRPPGFPNATHSHLCGLRLVLPTSFHLPEVPDMFY